MTDKRRVSLRLDLIGKYPIKTYPTFIDFSDWRKNNANRKIIIFDTGFYDDDYLEKLFIKKEDNGNN